LFEKQVTDKDLKLKMEPDPKVPATILGDVVKLRQVLYNLVSNAIKFTHKGEIIVSCKLLTLADNMATLKFEVSDTGIGIPADKLNSVFEEFTQADNSITRKYGGTGLGLNIVKRMVELQGGTIEVLSTPDVGSSFIATLTYTVSTADAINSNVEKEFSKDIFKGKTILVCDDEEMNTMLVEHILTGYGANVVVTSSAAEMIDKVEQVIPDLVLTDLHMPGMDGMEAISHIRSNINTRVAAVPIAALTGDVKPGEKERCLALGMMGFLVKPFVEAQLVELVDSVFKKSS